MNRSFGFRLFMALLLIAVLAGVGSMVYRAGMAQGMAIGAQMQSGAGDAAGRVAPWPGYYPMFGWHVGPPLFGFGFFGLVIPFFLLLLFFGALRGMFWRGRHSHWGHHHPGEPGQPMQPPSFFDEWHRQAHETPAEE